MPTPNLTPGEVKPSLPTVNPDPLKHLFTMYYRHGMNATLSKNFYFDGELVGAIERARKHCTIMNYRYIYTRPLVVDLHEEEVYKLTGGSSSVQRDEKIPG